MPSSRPRSHPTSSPTNVPTLCPSLRPTTLPSSRPSAQPVLRPTSKPSSNPTVYTATPTYTHSYVSITDVRWESTSSSIKLFVNVTEPAASVYCTALLANSSVTTVITSSTYLKMTGTSSVAVNLNAVITLPSLFADTAYDVYCLTVSGIGSVMPLNRIHTKVALAKTSCCKVATVNVNVRSVFINSVTQGAIGISLNAPPTEALVIKMNVFNATGDRVMDNLDGIHLYPASLTFYPDEFLLSSYPVKLLTVVAGANTGHYNLKASIRDSFSCMYTHGDVIKVMSYTQQPSVPIVETATFAQDGTSILVLFTAATDQAGYFSSFACNRLFRFDGKVVTSCSWIDAATVIMYTGNKASALTVGDNVTLIGGNVRAGCPAAVTDVSTCAGWNTSGTQIVTVAAPQRPIIPIVHFSMPAVVSSCSDAVVDLSLSTGNGGRNWTVSFEFAVTWTSTAAQAPIDSAVYERFVNYWSTHYSTIQSFRIPSIVLQPNLTYAVTAMLCSFLGACSQSAQSVSVSTGEHVPTLGIVGASELSLNRSQGLLLQTYSYIHDCKTGKLVYSDIVGGWSISMNGVDQGSKLQSTSKNTNIFRLAPFTLIVNSLYMFTYTVRSLADMSAASTSIVVNVQATELQANVAGATTKTVRAMEVFTVDASSSVDMDTGDNAGLSFMWSCSQVSPYYAALCLMQSLSDSNWSTVAPTVHILANLSLVNSTNVVTVVVAKDTRTSTRAVTIKILESIAAVIALYSVQPVVHVDTTSRFVLTGQVNTSELGCEARWTVDDPSLDLTSVSLSPTVVAVPVSSSLLLNLILPSGSLPAGTSLTFTLKCRQSVASVVVSTNAPPLPGSFTVVPRSGVEITTTFQLAVFQWIDSDLPLSFAFGFTQSHSFFTVCSQSASGSCSSILPGGHEGDGYTLVTFSKVYDSLGSFSTTTETVVISPSVDVELFDAQLTELLQDSVGNIDSMKQLLSSAANVINRANCSGVTSCAAMNRAGCQSTSFRCGPCLTGFIGDVGDANTACITLSAFTKYNYSGGGRSTCTSEDVCGPWANCLSGECIRPQKGCPTCLNGGVCAYFSTDAGSSVDECLLGDPGCKGVCSCLPSFAGDTCELDGASLLLRQGQLSGLLDQLAALTGSEDANTEAVVNWISNMASLAASSVTMGTISTVNKTSSLADLILAATITAKVASTNALQFLDVIDGHAIAVTALTTSTESANVSLFGNRLLGMLATFGEYVCGEMVNGESALQAMGTMYRLTTNVQNLGNISASVQLSDLESAAAVEATTAAVTYSAGDLQVTASSSLVRYSVLTLKSSIYGPMNSTGWKSDIVQFQLTGSDLVDEIKFTVPHYTDSRYREQIDQNITFSTVCSGAESYNYSFVCPISNVTLWNYCRHGVAQFVTSICPPIYMDFSCESFSSPLTGAADDNDVGPSGNLCRTLNVTSSSISCSCRPTGVRRRLGSTSDGSTSLSSSVVSTTVYFSSQFGQTLTGAENFNSLADIQKVITIIIMFCVLWFGGLVAVFGCVFKREYGKSAIAKAKNKHFAAKKIAAKIKSPQQIRDYLLGYVSEVFPSAFRNMSRAYRLRDEVIKHHRYVVLFSASSEANDRERIITGIQLLTVQTMLIFLLAVFYDLQAPSDDGSCPGYDTQQSCLAKKSYFNSAQTYCEWAPIVPGGAVGDDGQANYTCRYWPPYMSWYTIAVISVLVSMVTAIVNYPIDSFFDVLNAPLADSLKLKNSETTLQRVGRRMSNAARRVSVAATDVINTTVSNARRAFQNAEKKRENSLVGFVSLNIPESTQAAHEFAAATTHVIKGRMHGILEERQTKLIASAAYSKNKQFRKLDADVDSDDDDDENDDDGNSDRLSDGSVSKADAGIDGTDNREFQNAASPQPSVRPRISFWNRASSSESPIRNGAHSAPDFQSRLNELDVVYSANSNKIVGDFTGLVDKIDRQRYYLPSNERDKYDTDWGIDPTGEFAKQYMSRITGTRDTSEVIRSEMALASNQANSKIKKLSLATDDHTGLEILHLFIIDLLGRDTPVAKIFRSKSSEDFRAEKVVTRRYKAVAWTVLVFLNVFFVYYTMLRGFVKGLAWQRSFLIGCVVQCVVEMLFNETIECIWVNFLVPDLASAEVRKAASELETIIDNLCFGAKRTSAYFLNSCSYLFVSYKVAEAFPDLIESMLVMSYACHVPGQLSRKWKTGFAQTDLFSFDRRSRNWKTFSVVSIMVLSLQILGASPFVLQRMIIRLAQPWMLAMITAAFANVSKRPEYLIALVVVICGIAYLVVKKSNKVASEDDSDDVPVDREDAAISSKLAFDPAFSILEMEDAAQVVNPRGRRMPYDDESEGDRDLRDDEKRAGEEMKVDGSQHDGRPANSSFESASEVDNDEMKVSSSVLNVRTSADSASKSGSRSDSGSCTDSAADLRSQSGSRTASLANADSVASTRTSHNSSRASTAPMQPNQSTGSRSRSPADVDTGSVHSVSRRSGSEDGSKYSRSASGSSHAQSELTRSRSSSGSSRSQSSTGCSNPGESRKGDSISMHSFSTYSRSGTGSDSDSGSSSRTASNTSSGGGSRSGSQTDSQRKDRPQGGSSNSSLGSQSDNQGYCS
jgi:hypothetical protein